MVDGAGLKVLFVAGFGPIVRDPEASRSFYGDALGLPIEPMPHDPQYFHSEKIAGVRHFALWPLTHAADACFGTSAWPADLPVPHAWVEFDVENIATATAALKGRGCTLLVEARQEPWGQTVTRLLSPEGVLVGVTITPWLR